MRGRNGGGERQSPQAISPNWMFYAPYATDKDIGPPPRTGTCYVSSGRDSRMRTSLSFLGPLSTRAISFVRLKQSRGLPRFSTRNLSSRLQIGKWKGVRLLLLGSIGDRGPVARSGIRTTGRFC